MKNALLLPALQSSLFQCRGFFLRRKEFEQAIQAELAAAESVGFLRRCVLCCGCRFVFFFVSRFTVILLEFVLFGLFL